VKSNCVGATPETEFGRKRTIDQSSCNKDYSCVKGFARASSPSMAVPCARGEPRPQGEDRTLFPATPEPQLPSLEKPYGIMVTGVGVAPVS
jgi:indolepyruvate ferredoxin oxidoreductase